MPYGNAASKRQLNVSNPRRQPHPPLQKAAESPREPEPTENSPYKGSYEKFAVESAWLKERGFTPETLARYEVFEYNNPARRSAYSGSVMLKIPRYSDGRCVGYLSRNIGEITAAKPKYVFAKGLHKGLEVFERGN